MGRYVHLFQTLAEYNSARTPGNYEEPWLSYTMEASGSSFNKTEREKLNETPLTFIAQENGTFSFETRQQTENTLSYSLNSGATWTSLNKDTETPWIQSGSSVMWKGNCTPGSAGILQFVSNCRFIVEGNLMSLIYGDDFIGQTTFISSARTFYCLFSGCTQLTSAENMVLPATALTDYCYYRMFQGCTNLIAGPKLPATTMALSCYNGLFQSCTSLTKAPELPATTLAKRCYFYMFSDCTSLTSAPELPATILEEQCYDEMFAGCTNLNYIKCLATDISANKCTDYWVSDVAATGTFIKNPNMSSWTTGDNGIPTNWTVQDA